MILKTNSEVFATFKKESGYREKLQSNSNHIRNILKIWGYSNPNRSIAISIQAIDGKLF